MRKIWVLPVAAALVLGAAAGCSKKAEPPKTPPAGTEGGAPAPVAAPSEPAGPVYDLTGTIHFEGPAPVRKAIKMTADENCHKQHTEPVLAEDIIVGSGGGLKNVFVSVQSGIEGKTFAVPSEPVVLDQKGCMYSPHVWGVMANQTLRILNSDPTLHNVHGIPASGSGEFNVGMPRKDMEITRVFKEPGDIHFKCDVHPWMSSYGRVMANPFFAVSDDGGSYTIHNLPAGQYVIEAWQEKLGKQTATVTVGAGGGKQDFTFKPAAP